ncbi:hypothetical protein FIT70_04225 [Candidatus Methylopumilus universalis]|uniref:hypothetical protein n=1 Tax=Candidatus Methylopumilus universalis TaxID=2588536 RepID=UPI0011206CDF|nr:hypothetical protein [Candidatus Methylopumilus universalis]QDC99119.1 hypothetical protein FIT70_04225 [Candidatus Methylopumilus universalis]
MKNTKASKFKKKIKFFYHEIVATYLIALFDDLALLIHENYFVNILLIGSTSRNELSYKYSKKGIKFYSDIEFIVLYPFFLTKIFKTKLLRVLDKHNNGLLSYSPFFEIDYGFYSIFKLLMSPNSIWKYELSVNGILLGKNNILLNHFFKQININNLSLNSVNDLIYVRLWHSLRFISEKQTKENLNFMIARNCLDALTIFLPNQGILRSSYKSRNDYINTHRYDFTTKYKNIFVTALDIKLNIKHPLNSPIKLSNFLEMYKDLLHEIEHKKDSQQFDIRYRFRFFLLKLRAFHLIFQQKPINFRNNLAQLLIDMHTFVIAKKQSDVKSKETLLNIIKNHNLIFKNKLLTKNRSSYEIYMQSYKNLESIFSCILFNPSKERFTH